MADSFSKIANIVPQKGLLVFIFISLLIFQLIYSFLFPSVGFNDSWLPINSYIEKFSPETADNLILNTVYPFISTEYRLNSDVGEYLELAQDFSSSNFYNRPYLNRPLYSLLINLSSNLVKPFTTPSYGILFGLAILINLALIILTVLMFFYLLEKIFSFKVAFFSSILLIFSPLVHSFINQPIVEMLTAFAVMISLYLLHNYLIRPTPLKLIAFSMLVGILLLGKAFFAIPLFVLLLAVYFKRYREGIVFLVMVSVPYICWYLWVTKIWQIPYYVLEIQDWHMGIWLKNIFYWPRDKTFRIFISAIPNFIKALIYAFLALPLVFSVVGFGKLRRKAKIISYCGLAAIFSLAFLINLYLYRHAFMSFPIIYPTAILGIERTANWLKKYNRRYYFLFYLTIISIIIIISNINIYRFFSYIN